jgi:hypothetical protein
VRTDAPVYMRGGGGGDWESVASEAISLLSHTWWAAITDAPVHMRDREVEERWKRKMNANARLLWLKYDHPQLRGVAMKKIRKKIPICTWACTGAGTISEGTRFHADILGPTM